MNWSKVVIIGVVGGIVTWLYNFLMHGIIMSGAYAGNAVFVQPEDGSNPLWFLLVQVCTGIMAALLFVKTRSVWSDGFKGGATFGFFLGLVAFFPQFINPLVIQGFEYHLAWCWGGIVLIEMVVFGMVAGLILKSAE